MQSNPRVFLHEVFQPLAQQQQEPLRKAIRVLSLDGGGIRGIAVARILEGIERETCKRIHELFDVIVGTSTGGLLAVMMSIEVPETPDEMVEGICEEEKEHATLRKRQIQLKKELNLQRYRSVLTAEQAKNLYRLKAREIFHEEHNWWHSLTDRYKPLNILNHWLTSKYKDGDGLVRVVRDLYQYNDFSNAKTCVGVVVTERKSQQTVLLNCTNAKIFDEENFHHNLGLHQLVRATSAAPTYFNPIIVHNPFFWANRDNQRRERNNLRSSEFRDGYILQAKRRAYAFEDGGVTCNNPSVKAFKYARDLLDLYGDHPHEYQFQVYSIGTGELEPREYEEIDRDLSSKDTGSGNYHALKRILLPAFSDPFEITKTSRADHEKMEGILNDLHFRTQIPQKYFRIQFQAPKEVLEQLDNCDEASMQELEMYGKNVVECSPVFQEAIETLKVEVIRPKNLVSYSPSFENRE